MKFISGVTLVAFALTGCAGFSSSPNRNPQAEWRVGKFAVAFYPGPRAAGQDRTYSYYSIKSLLQKDVSPAVVESAYREQTDRDPKDSIRVISDSTGDRVLIREVSQTMLVPALTTLWSQRTLMVRSIIRF
jgi:hypothetical protein